jgi:hypothetical protein
MASVLRSSGSQTAPQPRLRSSNFDGPRRAIGALSIEDEFARLTCVIEQAMAGRAAEHQPGTLNAGSICLRLGSSRRKPLAAARAHHREPWQGDANHLLMNVEERVYQAEAWQDGLQRKQE